MTVRRLWTFQRLPRIARLRRTGVLRTTWDELNDDERDRYPAMVAAMLAGGVDTGGHPPIWAWSPRPTLLDACALFDPEHELSKGIATVEFDAPVSSTYDSCYGSWNDHLADRFDDPDARWTPTPPSPSSHEPVQVCLPLLRAEWVRAVRELPRSGWDGTIRLEEPA
ncbi:hypothetical protein WHI96_21005 [Pseudonocardia tropica]|uniref:DUF3841 domain-containing protein n=1 Tax=Pseudonocardia tropica TaxID=681289 RepID=A0ABV1JZA0_9PSEU